MIYYALAALALLAALAWLAMDAPEDALYAPVEDEDEEVST